MLRPLALRLLVLRLLVLRLLVLRLLAFHLPLQCWTRRRRPDSALHQRSPLNRHLLLPRRENRCQS